MKIGVISDPHANLQALEAVLNDMGDVDAILCAGDLVGYCAQPNEVIELIKKNRVKCVLGNHDRSAVTGELSGLNVAESKVATWTREALKAKNKRYLRGLSEKKTFKKGGKSIFIAHGSPRKPLIEYVFPGTPSRALLRMIQGVDSDVIILGHTHVPMERILQSKLIINPGGVGQPRDRDPKAAYAILDLEGEPKVEFKRVKYDVELASAKILEAELPREIATRIHFGW